MKTNKILRGTAAVLSAIVVFTSSVPGIVTENAYAYDGVSDNGTADIQADTQTESENSADTQTESENSAAVSIDEVQEYSSGISVQSGNTVQEKKVSEDSLSGNEVILTAETDGVRIKVTADPGVFPEGAFLKASKVTPAEKDRIEDAVDDKRSGNTDVAESLAFDIMITDGSGNEIEPDNSRGKVKVSFTAADVPVLYDDVAVYHVDEKGSTGGNSGENLKATRLSTDDGTGMSSHSGSTPEMTASAVTTGFSYYVVEFTYDSLKYEIGGDSTVKLSAIQKKLGLEGKVTAAESSDTDLFTVSRCGSDWDVTSKKAFSSAQTLKLTVDGTEYTIKVTDDSDKVAEVKTSSGTTEYSDFGTAMTAAGSVTASSVKLLADTELPGNTYNITNYITLDLNGHTLTMADKKSLLNIGAGGNLTINDSGTGGKITGGETAYFIEVCGNKNAATKEATLIVNGGTIENTYSDPSGTQIWNLLYSNVTINGGTFAGCQTKLSAGDNPTRKVYISGGHFDEGIKNGAAGHKVSEMISTGYALRAGSAGDYSFPSMDIQSVSEACDVVGVKSITVSMAENECSVLQGKSCQLAVTALSEDTLTYQWYKKFADGEFSKVSGATEAGLTLSAAETKAMAAGEYTYYCRVSGPSGYYVDSAQETVTVYAPTRYAVHCKPVADVNGLSVNVLSDVVEAEQGETVSLTVEAKGTADKLGYMSYGVKGTLTSDASKEVAMTEEEGTFDVSAGEIISKEYTYTFTMPFGDVDITPVLGYTAWTASMTANGVTKYYKDVREAFAGVPEGSTAEVKLLRDVDLGKYNIGNGNFGNTSLKGDVTFDLGGHTLSGSYSAVYFNGAGHDLKLMNGTITGNGGDGTVYWLSASKTLTVDQCNITCTADSAPAIRIERGKGILNGGSVITASNWQTDNYMSGVCSSRGESLTINDAILNNKGTGDILYDTDRININASKCLKGGNGKVSGGNSSASIYYGVSGADQLDNGNALTLSGEHKKYYKVDVSDFDSNRVTFAANSNIVSTNGSYYGLSGSTAGFTAETKEGWGLSGAPVVSCDAGVTAPEVTAAAGNTGTYNESDTMFLFQFSMPASCVKITPAVVNAAVINKIKPVAGGDTISKVYHNEPIAVSEVKGEDLTWKGSSPLVIAGYYTDEACNVKTGAGCGAASEGAAPKNAGTYYVRVSTAASDGYDAAAAVIKLTVAKAEMDIDSDSLTTVTYDGTAHSADVKLSGVNGEDVSAFDTDSTFYTEYGCKNQTTPENSGAAENGAAPVYGGTYYQRIWFNYPTKYSNYNACSRIVEVKINKKDWSTAGISVQAYQGIYDGNEHAAFTVSGSPDYAALQYSTDNGQSWSTSFGSIKDAKEYKAILQLDGGKNYTDRQIGTYTARISPKSLTEENVETDTIADQYFTGSEIKPAVVVHDKAIGNTLTSGTDFDTVYSDNINAGTASVKFTGKNNYTGSVKKNFTIRYADAPEISLTAADGSELTAVNGWYTQNVIIKNKTDAEAGTFSDDLTDWSQSYTVSAEGVNDLSLYYKDNASGKIANVKKTVKIDKSAPDFAEEGCGIKIKENVFRQLLKTLSWGLLYNDQTLDVTVKANDTASGVSRYYYCAVKDEDTMLSETQLNSKTFTELDSTGKFSISDEGRYIIYAYAADGAGNKSSYISSTGIVIDRTAPVLRLAESAAGDTSETLSVSLTGNDAGTMKYVVRNAKDTSIGAEDILAAGDCRTEAVSNAAKTINISGLIPGRTYYVYAFAEDKAGNRGLTAEYSFTTKKTSLTVAEAPKASGVYGTMLCDLTVTGGKAVTPDNTAVSGKWVISGSGSTRPDVGGVISYTYTFVPDDAERYSSVNAETVPVITPESIAAQEVTVSLSCDSYVYNGKAVKPEVIINDTRLGTAPTYTCQWDSDCNVGTKSAVITGTGNYTGTVTRTYKITKMTQILSLKEGVSPVSRTYGDGELNLFESVDYNYLTPVFSVSDGDDVLQPSGKSGHTSFVIKGAGRAVITASVEEDRNAYAAVCDEKIIVDVAKAEPKAGVTPYYAEIGSRADSITADRAYGVYGESVMGSYAWYTDSGHHDPADSYVFLGTAGDKKVLYWTFTPAESEKNYRSFSGQSEFVLTSKKVPEVQFKDFSKVYDAVPVSVNDIHVSAYSEGSIVPGTWSFADGTQEMKTAGSYEPRLIFTPEDQQSYESVQTVIPVTVSKKTLNACLRLSSSVITAGDNLPSVSLDITGYVGDDHLFNSSYDPLEHITGMPSDSTVPGKYIVTYMFPEKDHSIYDDNENLENYDYFSDLRVSTELTIVQKSSSDGGSNNSVKKVTSDDNESASQTGGQAAGQTESIRNDYPSAYGVKPGNNARKNGTAVRIRDDGGYADESLPIEKGDSAVSGWITIEAKAAGTKDGGTISIIMNGAHTVPGEVLEAIKGRDVSITFDMGDGISWTVNGKSITADNIDDIDFAVTKNSTAIPADVINKVTGERYSMNISLAYSGKFGFTATLSIDMGSKNEGMYANLFYYDPDTDQPEFMSSAEIGSDGIARLEFTHASDYTIVIDKNPMGTVISDVKGDAALSGNSTDDNGGKGNTGSTDRQTPNKDIMVSYKWFTGIIVIMLCAVAAMTIFRVITGIRKNKKTGD